MIQPSNKNKKCFFAEAHASKKTSKNDLTLSHLGQPLQEALHRPPPHSEPAASFAFGQPLLQACLLLHPPTLAKLGQPFQKACPVLHRPPPHSPPAASVAFGQPLLQASWGQPLLQACLLLHHPTLAQLWQPLQKARPVLHRPPPPV